SFQNATTPGQINFTVADGVLSALGGTTGTSATGTATFSSTTGATVAIGNTAFVFSPASINAALSAAGLSSNNVTVSVQPVSSGTGNVGGPGQFSVNGTFYRVVIT